MTLAEFEQKLDETLAFLEENGLVSVTVGEDGEQRMVLTEAGQDVANQFGEGEKL